MTTSKEHTWEPIAGEAGQYRCTDEGCGIVGYRKRSGEGAGMIVPHKDRSTAKKLSAPEVTRKQTGGPSSSVSMRGGPAPLFGQRRLGGSRHRQ